jgi:hypothetical protein
MKYYITNTPIDLALYEFDMETPVAKGNVSRPIEWPTLFFFFFFGERK